VKGTGTLLRRKSLKTGCKSYVEKLAATRHGAKETLYRGTYFNGKEETRREEAGNYLGTDGIEEGIAEKKGLQNITHDVQPP